MRTSTIVNPLGYEPKVLLAMIESTPDAFTAGRRNNDMVNWFVAMRLIDLEAGEDQHRMAYQIEDAYNDAFDALIDRLNEQQKDDLLHWMEGGHRLHPSSKMYRLAHSYARWRDPRALCNVWLPMDYMSPGAQPENQLELPTTEG